MFRIISAMFSDNSGEQYLHKHNCRQILCYTKGKGSMLIGGKKLQVREKYLVYIPSELSHRDHNEGERLEYVTLLFESDDEIFGSDAFVIAEENNEIINCTVDMASYFQMNQDRYSGIINALSDFLTEKVKLHKNMSHDELAVENYQKIMIMNIADPEYTVNTFMNSIDITRSNISKRFRSASDCTAKQLFDNLRIEHAKQIILHDEENEKSTEDIARICGYDEEYYFSRMFRNRTGMTISEFKKNKKYDKQ